MRETSKAASAETSWQLGRIEIRTRLTPSAEIVARVELLHPERGRVADIASGPGGVEAAMNATRQILGVDAAVEKLTVIGSASGAKVFDDVLKVSALVSVRIGSFAVPGTAVAGDLLSACLLAYLDAISRWERRVHYTTAKTLGPKTAPLPTA